MSNTRKQQPANPLLADSDLPLFDAIQAEHVSPAIDQLLADNRARLSELLTQENLDWDGLMQPLEAMDDQLNQAWSPVVHLNAVVNSPALRDAYNENIPKLSDYETEMGQNRQLFDAFRSLADRQDELGLDAAQRKVLADELRDFRLSGVDLPEDKQARFKEIQQQLSSLQAKFEENLIDAAAAWHLKVTEERQLAGIPDDAIARARGIAQEGGHDGWWFALDFPHYHAIATHAENEELRRAMYEAWVTRGSDQGPTAGTYDNSDIMREILALRQEEAGLLGYDNFAEVSLASKMADSTEEVETFLLRLLERVKPRAEQEFAALCDFARDELGMKTVNAWDTGFASERLRKARYDLSQQELKPYFPLQKAIDGLFWLVGELYGFSVKETAASHTWHPDVRLFEITDANGEHRGRLYMDLFARPQKRSGAWMDEVKNRFRKSSGLQHPVAHLVCNFSPPGKDGKPATLTHDDVQTLFHEFGHCLHHLSTQVDYPSVAGINGVAWDAVELPSQFHENFCWDRDILKRLTAHVDSGESLPDVLIDRMLAARHFNAGLFLVRQLEFALFDLRLHRQPGADVGATLAATRQEVAVVPAPAFNRFAHGFSHIFAGGYAAGYYSYLWAEVMSSDAFGAFEEAGLLDKATGRRFLNCILEKGGSAEPGELFVAFRGRAANEDAFLRHHGMDK
ncbi:MAG: M3 family metallopeptidase [Gammaproteobacteria bacterium]|nr:M3 family metallopeptidase [Gammaproteobacteria bacterium]